MTTATRTVSLRRLAPADLVVGMVVLVQCVSLFAVNIRGSFFSDDFMLFGQAADATLGYDYLSLIAFQHLVPALRLATWLLLHTVGLDWTVAQVFVVLCVALTSVTFYAIVKLLTERPWLAVAATAFVGVTLFNQAGSRWWSSALSVYPLITCIALTCLFYLRFLRSGSRWQLAVAVAAFAGACFCHQSAPFAFLYLVLLRLIAADRRLVAFAADTRPEAMRWRHLGWFVALSAMLLAYYRLVPEIGYLPSPGVMPTARRTATSLFDVFLPAAAGVTPSIETTTFGEVAADVVLIGLGLLSVVLVPRTLRIWIGFGVVYAANIALLVYQRMSMFGPTIVYDLRYYAQLSLAFGVAAACVVAVVLRRRSAATPTRWPRHAPAALAVTALVVYLVVTTGSVLDLQRAWTLNTDPPKAFLGTLSTAVDAAERQPNDARPALLDRVLPDRVVASWLTSFNTVANVAPLVGDLPVGEYRPRLAAVDDEGALVPMRAVRRAAFPITPEQREACRTEQPSALRLDLSQSLPAPTGAWAQPPFVVVELQRPVSSGRFTLQPTSGPNAAGYYEVPASGTGSVTVPVLAAADATVDGLNLSLPPGACVRDAWLAQARPAG